MSEMDSVSVAAELGALISGDVFGDILHRAAYSGDASIYQVLPKCVALPREAGDVVKIVCYAKEHGLCVAARGAGSGLAGESLCEGIVIDMRQYMARVLEISYDGERVVCEPGVVLEELNKRLSEYGRKIGPDPSSGNRATIGGVIANNATGAHSLQYGYISAYLEAVEMVLADGSVVELTNEMEVDKVGDDRAGELVKKCYEVLSENEAVINDALPKTKRNRSGYNVAGLCHDGRIDLARLVASSEGTLGVMTKVTLRTVAVPAVKGVVQLEFATRGDMAKAVPAIVDSGAAACELMDRSVIDMAVAALPEYRDVYPEDAQVVLLVEHVGESEEEVRGKIAKTIEAVGELACGKMIVFDEAKQKRLWKSRKDAVPLLYRRRQKARPIAFIEDVSVENHRLADYIEGLEKISAKYDIEMSYYGHAGDGELHVRPYIDLRADGGAEKMRAIADEVFSLAWSMGGSISGEHADGLVRAAYIRQQYGDKYYEILRGVKRIFDADGLMNPGKIINDDADVMVKSLRADHAFLPERLKSRLLFGDDELNFELDQCNGCGLCLNRAEELRMCPVFGAMGEELGSSRAKANILRFWATGQLDEKDFESEDFKRFIGLCTNCKACSVQCPSGVDVSKLITAARAEYAKRKGLKRAEMMLSRNKYLAQLSSMFNPISNFVMGFGITSWFVDKLGGLDRRRGLPRFGRRSFISKGRKYLASEGAIEKPIDKVAYFVDTYANYNDQELGFAVSKVLRANGVEVILPKQRPAPLPAICYGDVDYAKRELEYSVRYLAEAVKDGYKVVCSEPSAALCLKEEMKLFVRGEAAELVSENTYELMSYLDGLYKEGKLKKPAGAAKREFVYHKPCHLMALGCDGASAELLAGLLGWDVKDLNAGCCGLAGTFGMQKKNYELSEKISSRLRDALAANRACDVLTECGACGMQIEHISGRKSVHPVKLLARAYGLGV